MATKKNEELNEAVTEEQVQDKSPAKVDPKDAEIQRIQAQLRRNRGNAVLESLLAEPGEA